MMNYQTNFTIKLLNFSTFTVSIFRSLIPTFGKGFSAEEIRCVFDDI